MPAAQLLGALVLLGLALPRLAGLDLADRALRLLHRLGALRSRAGADPVLVDLAGLGCGDLTHVRLDGVERDAVVGELVGAVVDVGLGDVGLGDGLVALVVDTAGGVGGEPLLGGDALLGFLVAAGDDDPGDVGLGPGSGGVGSVARPRGVLLGQREDLPIERRRESLGVAGGLLELRPLGRVVGIGGLGVAQGG